MKDSKRHERKCRVCVHPRREEIEEAVIQWQPPTQIARQYRLNRRALHRHIAALGLLALRDKNIRAILTRVVEKGLSALRNVRASEIVSATVALSKIDASGQWIDRTHSVHVHEYLAEMSNSELEALIDKQEIPDWIQEEIKKHKEQLGRGQIN